MKNIFVMTSVLNIEPNNIIIRDNKQDFLYNFFRFFKDIII